MPNKGFLINFIDNLTLLTLFFIVAILLIKKCWQNKALICILINALYSIFLILIAYRFPLENEENEIISNLTMHIDTFSGLGFLYYLWNDQPFRKYLIYSVIPVIALWLFTFIWKQDLKIHFWNLLLPSFWFLVAAQYAMILLYKRSNFQETSRYISRFLLIAGFLFYNFIYLIVETCYIFFKSISNTADAWSINYWGYFIFRLLMLAGVIAWYSRRMRPANNIATVRK
jgi:hypothetical protein